jgi:hypothetical protein
MASGWRERIGAGIVVAHIHLYKEMCVDETRHDSGEVDSCVLSYSAYASNFGP